MVRVRTTPLLHRVLVYAASSLLAVLSCLPPFPFCFCFFSLSFYLHIYLPAIRDYNASVETKNVNVTSFGAF